jgi:hypothetical protein
VILLDFEYDGLNEADLTSAPGQNTHVAYVTVPQCNPSGGLSGSPPKQTSRLLVNSISYRQLMESLAEVPSDLLVNEASKGTLPLAQFELREIMIWVYDANVIDALAPKHLIRCSRVAQ